MLTPVAAFSLGLIMLPAARVHAKRKESKEMMMNIVLLVLLLLVGILRLA